MKCGECGSIFYKRAEFEAHDCIVRARSSHDFSSYLARCRRCGTDEMQQIVRPIPCLTDAEVAVSLNIQRVFDQQQKRAVALFNGGL